MSNSFSKNLKALMRQSNLTAKQVCAETGISASTFSMWLNGSRHPRFDDSIVHLARFLRVSLEVLLTGSEPEQQIINEIMANEAFTVVHKGEYRVTVEKKAHSPKNKREKF